MNLVQVRLEAVDGPVGWLRSLDNGSVQFAYEVDYLEREDAHAISLALPLRERAFSDSETRCFFDNLLPENNQLRAVIEREGLERGDLVGILYHLGSDVSGAISCLPPDAPPAKVPGLLDRDYDFLSKEDVVDIVRRLATHRPLPNELKDPSPVAGYQRKISLVRTIDDRIALPKRGSGVPTTHILKVPDESLPYESFLEAAAAGIAHGLGLDAAPSRAEWIGAFQSLSATRFDRIMSENGQINRLHQEDFAQAMSLPSRLKYERSGQPGRAFSAGAIAALLQRTAEPALAADSFMRATFFNLSIGNTDNHAKNHALIYDVGPTPRLAPLYDLVPILLSENHHHRFAFSIGAAAQAESLRFEDLINFIGVFGLTPAAIERFVAGKILPMLRQLAQPRNPLEPWSVQFDNLIVHQSRFLLGLLEPVFGTA
jgi:serine/threonine-protein kinase HipA